MTQHIRCAADLNHLSGHYPTGWFLMPKGRDSSAAHPLPIPPLPHG